MSRPSNYHFCIWLSLATHLAAGAAPAHVPVTATLAVLETTDLHSSVLGFDYYKLAPDPSLGLDRTATLIAQARAQFQNTLLLDNGDTIQGSALADYQALAAPPACDEPLAIYKAMNLLGFDGGGVGNHEFNYGLAYLSRVSATRFDVDGVDPAAARCAGPNFPIVLANVFSTRTHAPLFAPYKIIDKAITAQDASGKPVKTTIKVGIIGFTPPAVVAWDKRWLDGKVYSIGVREAAERFIPEMRKKGAQLIIALSHGGLDDAPYGPTMENANLYLSQVAGIDAMLIGHSHQVFPNAASTVAQFQLAGVDKVKGTVNGVPSVMAGVWGKQLGVIGLHLSFDGKRWAVERSATTVEARSTQQADKSYIAPDPAIGALVAREHAATIGYVKTPIGSSEFRMSTYFADVGDMTALAVLHRAQADYVRAYLQANLPQYASLPLLSAMAPLKFGAAGVTDYTDVAAGQLALNNAADLYVFPNTVAAVKVSGADVKAWLEKGAERFNTIDPGRTQAQELINARVAGYDFDTLYSPQLAYEIDVTQAPGRRIVKLTYRGQAVGDDAQFIVATNNYRASSGRFPGLNGSKTVLASPDASRDVLINFVKLVKTLTRSAYGVERSWRFAHTSTAGQVVFHSAPNGIELAHQAGLANVSLVQPDDGQGKGFTLYAIDLSR